MPTALGERLFARTSGALAELNHARIEVLEASRAGLPSAVIGLPPTLSRILVRPLAQRLIRQFPDARLRFVEGFSGHLLEWLDQGRVDIAILYENAATRRLGAEPLVNERLSLISAADAAWLGTTVPSALLGSVPLILPSAPHGLRRLIDEVASQQHLSFDIRIEADSLDSILALVKAGLGRAVLPRAAVRAELDRGELRETLLVSPEVTRTLILAAPNSRPQLRGYREAAAAIKAEVAAQCV